MRLLCGCFQTITLVVKVSNWIGRPLLNLNVGVMKLVQTKKIVEAKQRNANVSPTTLERNVTSAVEIIGCHPMNVKNAMPVIIVRSPIKLENATNQMVNVNAHPGPPPPLPLTKLLYCSPHS